ncbi:hypothetical protein D3Y59_04095 [Hymenobacter oligotrophus]|uniref:Uncharacterized protein n=1 Tax=Hymenobacter oligotrophus TaxID=2319843 RepID=A0A3B7QXN9_9BACT|nr:hypothetical protein [Hymenobacter oligotrophus]AYA36315.1 hypothetical protein D3Y59_04095 [Hymenobacter oligotrophus]
MDEALLAFYQQLYTGTPLYVVPEPGTAAPLAAPAAPTVAAPAVAAAAAVASSAAQPVPPAVTPPPASVASAAGGQGKLPSLADLKAARSAAPATPPPAPAPVAAPTAPPVLAAPPVSAPPVAPQAPPQRPPVDFDTLGSNANGLILLVRLEDPTRLPRIQRNVFLNNMLKAIQRVMEECVIVNVKSPYPVSLEELRARGLAVREVIGFGKNLLDVATKRTQPYEPVRIGDVAYLPAAEVEMIEYDNGRKKQLWQALQRMFLA